MQIKILINSNPFYAASASANRWLTLIEGMNSLGAKIQLVIVGNYQTKNEKEKFESISEIKGIKINYLNPKIVDTLWKRRYYNYIGKHIQSISTRKKILKELKDFNGIVWTENDLILWKTISAINSKSFKLISEMSEFLDIHHFNKGNKLQKLAGDAKQKYFEKSYINNLDAFVLMTKTLIRHYSNFNNPPPLLHLPMTVDLDRFDSTEAPPPEFKRPYIAFVGVMNDAKDGVNILIEAFNNIAYKYPEMNLYLVGAWNYDTPAHQARIKELGLSERIKWMGEYPREIIPSIICNAKILALPRPDSKQAQGGFPTKLGEYLATGNPVCATTVGEIPHYLKDKESILFAEPGSVDSFAKALDFTLQNPEKAKEVGLEGKKVAETNFNKTIQSEKLYNFLEKIQNEIQK